MVLEFIKQKNKGLSEENKIYYQKQLYNIGQNGNNYENRLRKLNICYNNAHHGVVPQFFDIYGFLEDIQKVTRSKNDTLLIEGTDHMDPSSRRSPFVVIINPFTGMYEEAMIRDKYITIQYKPDNGIEAKNKYSNLIPFFKYHLLVDLPQVENATKLYTNIFYHCFV